MTDDAIVTKYRPKKFSEVIGQDAVVRSLEHSVEKGLSKAYLFVGPSGTGKTTLARITAVALGCDPDDIQEEDAATQTGIENIRSIIDGLQYRPMGKDATKGIIIDEVHALSKNAMTALLKSLEDPPAHVRWFLCTTEEGKIPKAIRTRCATYNLKEVRTRELITLLESTDEVKDVDPDIIELCADEALGSPRQALSNLGVCVTAKDYDEAADLLRAAGESPEAFEFAQALMKNAKWEDLMELLRLLQEKGTNPESVRHVVRAYMTTVAMKSGKNLGYVLDILEAFSQPFNSGDGMSPLVIACGRIVFK